MKTKLFFGILLLVILSSCVDDRELDFEGIEANPKYEANFVNFNFSAEEINVGNTSAGNRYVDATSVDFFEQEVNVDYLDSLSIQMNIESTIDTRMRVKFKFFQDDSINFRLIESIQAVQPGDSLNPSNQIVEVRLTEDEVYDVVRSEYVRVSVKQDSTASNNGHFDFKSILRFSYLYTDE